MAAGLHDPVRTGRDGAHAAAAWSESRRALWTVATDRRRDQTSFQRKVPACRHREIHLLAGSRHLSLHLSLCLCFDPCWGHCEIWGHEIKLRIADVNAGILFLFALSPPWRSMEWFWPAGHPTNRYSLMGSLRGTAQMISYEIPMGLSILTVALAAGTLSLPEIVEAQRDHWFIWTNPVSFLIYLITGFAETNRAPFDLPEAEQELTAGYHTEYGGMKFAAFFLRGICQYPRGLIDRCDALFWRMARAREHPCPLVSDQSGSLRLLLHLGARRRWPASATTS